MLVGLDDSRVDQNVFVVRILRQDFEDALPNTPFASARMAQVHNAKVAKVFGQIPPSDACAVAVQYRLDKQSVVSRCPAHIGPGQEIYSIDESFIDLAGVQGDLSARARAVKARIEQWTGIPTCIGIGATKTLAKLANNIAKTAERKPGSYPAALAQVCNLSALPPSDLDAILQATPVGQIWGVGRRIGSQLIDGGICTALDLVRMDPATVRRRWSVVLERTVRELQSLSYIALEHQPTPKKEIACTRSFGRPVTELEPLIEAVSDFAGRAAEKLRLQASVASEVLVFIHTSPHRPGPRFSKSAVVPLRRSTADTAALVQAAVVELRSIYQPGFDFIKAGVMLLDLVPGSLYQGELDLEPAFRDERATLMSTIDALNGKYGKGTVHLASTGIDDSTRVWSMRQDRLTPGYTSGWLDIPIAKAV